jgi:hypothetical protein
MTDETLVKLAQDLLWLGCEASFYSKRTTDAGAAKFMERQRQLMVTAEKIERELKSAVRFNLSSLVGVDYPMEWAFDSISDLLSALQNIKQSAVDGTRDLPSRVRQFSHMVENYVEGSLPLSA